MASGPTITAKFVADTSELSGVGKTVAGAFSVNQLTEFAGNVTNVIGKVGEFGASLVEAGSSLAESTSKIGVVFGDQASSVMDWSKDSATAMGISQAAALEAAGTYGNLAVAIGLPQDKAADMSTSLVGLASDMASFNNVPVDDALQALQSGLTGETEPLKKFGINMNDTALKAEALSLGLVQSSVDMDKLSSAQETSDKASRKAADALAKHGAESQEFKDAQLDAEQAASKLAKVMEGKVPDSLTASQKAQAAYSLIMEQSSTAQGDFARTSDGLANQQKIAAAQMDNLKASIGTALLPALTTIASFLTVTLLPAFETTFGWIMDNKTVVIAAIIGIGAVLLPMFISWAVAAGAAAIATIAAAAPFIAIGAVIAGVAYLIITNWDTIVAATKAAWDAVVGAVQFVWNWIKDNWPLLLTILTGPIGAAVALIVTHWDTIKNAVMTAYNWVKDNWPLLLAIITGPIGAAVLIVSRNWDSIKAGAQAVWGWLNGTWQTITGIITRPIQSAKDTIVGLWDDIKGAATGAYNWVKQKFDDMASAISGVLSGITGAVSNIVNAIKNPINSMIRAWNGLEFRIPSFTLPSVDTHIPGVGTIGGGTFGGQVIGFPNIPTLAAGGVLTSATLFVGGEAGTEIVSPEALLRQIMREEGGGYTLNIYPRTADAADIAYGFRRLELMAGVA